MTGKTAMIPLFLNLLSLIAPTLWVLASGALGVGIGAYGPRLINRLKHDRIARPTNSTNAAKVPKRSAARRLSRSAKAKPNPSSRGNGRKRPSA